MKRLTRTRTARIIACALTAAMVWMLSPGPVIAAAPRRERTPRPRQRQRPPLRVLGDSEMSRLRGAGHRMPMFAGRHQWWDFEKEVNVTGIGNLLKSYTDLTLPGRGPKLEFVRSYNSLDPRVGPFGIGWTHSYDICVVDDDDDPTTVSRTTRSGTRFFYQRNADGLYTPPPYTHDQFTSDYVTIEDIDESLISVPINDKIITKDGTVYTFQSLASQPDGSPSPVRQIVRINDRHVNEYNPLGNHIDFDYGAAYTDADGHGRCELTSITDTVGRVISLTYTPERRLASLNWTCDGEPRSVVYGYDADYNLASATDPCGRVTAFECYPPAQVYGEAGVLKSITDPAGEQTVYTYTVPLAMYWLAVDTVSEPNGLRTWFYYYAPAGAVGMVVWNLEDTNTGQFIGYTGEGIGRFGAECHNDANYRFISTLGTWPQREYEYDCANNLTEIAEVLGIVWRPTTRMTYDATCQGDTLIDPGMGNLLSSSRTADDVEWHTTTFEYDPTFNQPTESTDPNGHVTQSEYDPVSGDLRYQYDARYPETGARTELRYNEFGERVELIDANGHSTQYEYGDDYGNPTAVVDALGRRTECVYDSVGNLRFKTDAKGQTTEYRYYPDSQVSDVIFDDGSTIHYTYDAAGRTAAIADHRGTMTFQYDEVGHLTAVTDPVLGTASYEYYASGNRKTLTYDGQTTTYYYATDNTNRLTAMVDHAGRRTNYIHDGHGNIAAVIYPNRRSIGGQLRYLAAVVTYDRQHRLLTLEGRRIQGDDPTDGQLYYGADDFLPPSGGILLASRGYTHGPAGNRLTCALTDVQGSALEQYTYDANNALTDVDYGDGTTAHYVYDPAGNRTQQTVGGEVTDYTYDAANQMITAGDLVFEYDANGNSALRIDGPKVIQYHWDVRDLLVRVDLPDMVHDEYDYDALGRRVETVDSVGEVTRVMRDGDLPLAERDGTGALLCSYLSADGLLVGREEAGDMSCYLHDVQGSVIALADNDRDIVASYRYGAFGRVRSSTGSSNNTFRYTGAHGATTEMAMLVHMGLRPYQWESGRFLSLDPQREGTNWYRYGENNPVNYIDPTGQWSEENINPWLRLGAGISFVRFGIWFILFGARQLQSIAACWYAGPPDTILSLALFGALLTLGVGAIGLGVELIAYGRNLIHAALIEIIDEW